LKAFLYFWLQRNAEVALQHCAATKNTKTLPKIQKLVQVYFVQQFLFWENTTFNCEGDIGIL